MISTCTSHNATSTALEKDMNYSRTLHPMNNGITNPPRIAETTLGRFSILTRFWQNSLKWSCPLNLTSNMKCYFAIFSFAISYPNVKESIILSIALATPSSYLVAYWSWKFSSLIHKLHESYDFEVISQDEIDQLRVSIVLSVQFDEGQQAIFAAKVVRLTNLEKARGNLTLISSYFMPDVVSSKECLDFQAKRREIWHMLRPAELEKVDRVLFPVLHL